jgi:ribonucleoside-triphosphate reductase
MLDNTAKTPQVLAPTFQIAVVVQSMPIAYDDDADRNGVPDTGTQVYSNFIHQSRYARWMEDQSRREHWGETVPRYFAFFHEKLRRDLHDDVYQALLPDLAALQHAVLRLDVVPSMRALWSAGPSLKSCNVVGYNCSYVAVDSPRAFDEAIYILMSGCGLGFSVERQYVKKLPVVAEIVEDCDDVIVVVDSREGWASAYRELIESLYAGRVPRWDLTGLRSAGARLKTSGGRSSGPRPLDDLFRFTVSIFREAAGRRLHSIECHDIMCMIGRIVVMGGVRRSAEISLSNPSDDRLRGAKSGQWWIDNDQRSLANNSAAYTERPDFPVFMREWWALYESKSGERGIYNRVAAQRKAEAIGREPWDFGINPCAEISLRSMQFCNLTEVVVRPDDTLETLTAKVRYAAALGTLQSDLLDFKYLRDEWRDNCAEERLLGVSLTGITDHPIFGDPDHPALPALLATLRDAARDANAMWAEALGIPASKAITTVKPSGTVSQLVNSSSGIHPRHAPYYIRRVRADINDPLAQLMRDQGWPCEVDERTPTNLVFSFPVASPPNARFAADIDALTQAKLWLAYAEHWADHSVSCTIYYSDDEFLALGQWVWTNFDKITGLSFLPRHDHTYVQAPYETISREQYEAMVAQQPAAIECQRLADYETEDHTHGARTLSCSGDSCEFVDIGATVTV